MPSPHKTQTRARSPSALEIASGMTGVGEHYMDLDSPTTPTTQSMKLRLRKQLSTASSSTANEETRGRKTVTRVKNISRRPEERAFRRHIGRAARAAAGVLLAGVIQTGSSASSTGSKFLPSFYYLGGLAYAAIMVIYASAPTVGGVVQQIWQIDLGVGLALLYNFGVFLVIPITQGDLVSVPENLNDSPYFVSLHDWGLVSPFMLAFTFVIFLLPIQHNVKKFAVMSNAFFMLKFINPMNPRVGGTGLKDLNNSDYATQGLMKNLAVYSIIGVVGTLISLMTALVPTPLFATRKLMRRMDHAPNDIRKILNLIMDSYCFRVKDIKKMDFFRLRLDRLLSVAQHRLSEMEELLDDCWWEEIVGVGLCLTFNKNVAKQFVKLYARLLKDLRAMKFAIEAENGHWTHVVLMKRMQQSLHIMQAEANDLLHEIAERVLEASTEMPTVKFAHLEQTVNHFMKKYTKLYGAMLSAEVHTPGDVGKTMSLNVFIYSFHSFVHTLFEFEERLNHKNFSCRYRIAKFFKMVWCSIYQGTMYMKRMTMFAVRTTLAVLIAYCISTFVFAFSATGPTAIAMVAQFHVGGTYGNMRNRMAGLVAGTVVPSILHFFVCKISDVVLYNALNNAVLFGWIVGSMYVCYSSSYLRMAGMVSAYMSASVLLDHSCRTTTKALSYSSLTENSVAIITLMLVEVCLQPQSARGLLRSNIQQVLGAYSKVFRRVFVHHITSTDATAPSVGDLPTVNETDSMTAKLSEEETRALHKQLSIILPAILKQQKKLVQDATAEPSLWKATFSNEQYTQVLAVCWTLLDRLRLLSDLVEWRERWNRDCNQEGYRLKRRNAGTLNEECTAAFKEQEEERAQQPETVYVTAIAPTTADMIPEAPLPPLPSNATPAVAKARWDRSRNAYESVVDESLDALVTLFSKDFTYKTADDYAIYLQMKEAFRIADKDRSGTVDASELVVLLEKLMPYTGGQGNVHMEQYVDEFMRLVDKNHDGQITFAEFMQALNDGFRLELEIYENTTQMISSNADHQLNQEPPLQQQECPASMDISDDSSGIDLLESSTATSDALMTLPGSAARVLMPRSTMFFTPPSSSSGLDSYVFGGSGDERGQIPKTGTSKRHRWWTQPRTDSTGVALLNVESFSLNEAAATLKQSYGELLLRSLDDDDQHVTMEDFIVMSCLISACEDIAANLTRLNTLAAS
ncbi:hypothetical protein PC129_g7927 [Phytophthora cactorum]|nr:hypothetical protein Pcac1_g22750 [Phytophthora cactorum]KAG2859535.1 hypothetical protein PC113_g8851 [Phytophthora cactorum]KAG2911404.1 hypothetical protein PC114_g9377 [Phytophthora cactorum]KAG2944396.1 hypothetical protein PC117_g9035 [Phytophthora cactorum]KAG3022639.1 hypothetical protein PC119_g9204 [Phytophthora cactorum]